MLIEDEGEGLEDRPCPVCLDDDNEDVLLECDNCGAYYHTYCVGLDDVPVGHWFCEDCETQRAIESVCHTNAEQPLRRAHNTIERRTRGQQRQIRLRNQATSSDWARVWQSIRYGADLDLDFPFDEEMETAHNDRTRRAASQRRDTRAWERRFQVAERQGGANRFRDAASALLDLHAPREQPRLPEPESREEIRAWNAFEKAKEIDFDPAPKRKRKSVTTSPSDADPVAKPERPLKRPRTRRLPRNSDTSSSTPAASRRSSAGAPASFRTSGVHTVAHPTKGPSFLQSMLREIETSSAPDESKGSSRLSTFTTTDHVSPQPSSPGASPTNSNHASPRAGSTTPPPSVSTRPGSPLSLTSKVEPIYPPPEFSPNRSPPSEASLAHRSRVDNKQTLRDRRQSQYKKQNSSSPGSDETSPVRTIMPFSIKSDLQKMVSTALKPHYQSCTVSKDEYTDINRNVSRMLYDRVGGTGNVQDSERENWEQLANDEVAKAVQSLKATS